MKIRAGGGALGQEGGGTLGQQGKPIRKTFQLNPELGQKCSEITNKMIKRTKIHRKQLVYASLIVNS